MPFSFKRLANSLPLSGLFRKLEQDMETVVKVLQPGQLGIIEHKFSAEEICKANETVKRAVENWKLNAKIEQHSPFLKDFIDNCLDPGRLGAPHHARRTKLHEGQLSLSWSQAANLATKILKEIVMGSVVSVHV